MTDESAVEAPGDSGDSTELGLSFVLPGSWAPIPVDSQKAAYDAIGRLLKERVPRRDELAALRRETREMLRGVADEARENGVDFLALSLEILPGIPFSASIVATYREADESEPVAPIADRLRGAVPQGEFVELRSGPGVRSAEVTTGSEDGAVLESVDLVYVVPTPDPRRWLQVIADVPTEIDPDLVVELFDAIVGSVLWTTSRIGSSTVGVAMT